jgi:ABC-type multidrug transport system ATPase subunit
LINILIGALSHTGGEVFVEGMDVQTQRNDIRRIVGVCPQFDILWE